MTTKDPTRSLSRTLTNQGTSRILTIGLALMMALTGLAAVAASSGAATQDSISEETTIGPRLQEKLATAESDQLIEAIIQMDGPVTEGQLDDAIELGLEVRPPLDTMPVFLVRGTSSQIQTYVDEAPVQRAEWNHPIDRIMETARLATSVAGVTGSDAPGVPGPLTLGGEAVNGSGIGIGIIDTGIDASHPDLPYGDKVLQNKKYACGSPGLINVNTRRCYVNWLAGDLIPNGTQQNLDTCVESNHQDGIDQFSVWVETPMADTTSGHGTHVAGIAAGTGAASDGELRGVAPGAKLYGLSIGESFGVAGLLYATMEAFDWVLCNHDQVTPSIKVINNSWGLSGCNAGEASSIAKELIRTLLDRGITVAFAAGNDGGDGSENCVNPFARIDGAPGLINVANYNDMDIGSQKAALDASSSRGLDGDDLSYPDVSAPGTRISAPKAKAGHTSIGIPDGRHAPNYHQLTGTSMATPHVVGVVALMYQVNPNLTASQVEDILEDTAREFSAGDAYDESDPFNPDQDSNHTFDKGHGLVDARAAVQAAADAAGTTLGDSPASGTFSPQNESLFLDTDPTGVQNVDFDYAPWQETAPSDDLPGMWTDYSPLTNFNPLWWTTTIPHGDVQLDGTNVTFEFWADSLTTRAEESFLPEAPLYEVTLKVGSFQQTVEPTSEDANATPRHYVVTFENVTAEDTALGLRLDSRFFDASLHNALIYGSAEYPTSLTFGETSTGGEEPGVQDGEVCITSRDPAVCFQSVQPAIDEANPGETITAGDGDYTEAVTIDKAVTLTSVSGETETRILGPAGTTPVTISADGATFQGFSVHHVDDADEGALVDVTGPNATVERLNLVAGNGTALALSASNVALSGSLIDAPTAIEATGAASGTLANNMIGGGQGTGLLVESSQALTVENNQFGQNTIHIRDASGVMDLRAALGANTFSNATLIADDGALVSGIYDDVQPAVDDAQAGQSVLVDSGTYETSLTLSTSGLTVCPANAAADGCATSGVTLDASGVSTTVVDIQASNVTLKGLDLQWSGTLEETVTGVRVGADGAVVRDGSITLPAAGCDAFDACAGPQTLGVDARAGTTVTNMVIEATPGTDNPGEAGTAGVASFTAQPVTVEASSVSGFTIGTITWADDLTVTDTRFEAVFTGVQLAGDDVLVEDIDVTGANSGVYIAGGSDITQTNITIRGSHLAEALYPVLFQDDKQGAEVDARLNYWGVARESLIRESIGNSDDNRIIVVPYLDAAGVQHPGPVEVHCFTDEDGDGFATLSQIATVPFFQAAVDLTLPTDCEDRDGDGDLHRTLILQEDEEAYNGATIDTPVSIFSNATGRTNVQTDGIVAGGARIESNNHQTAIELVNGSQGSTVDGVTVQAEPVGAPGITVDVPGETPQIELKNIRVGTREHPTSTGLTVLDTNGIEVSSSIFVSGQPAIDLQGGADAEITGSSITLSPTSPDDPTRPAGAIRATDAVHPTIADNKIHGAQTPNSQAIALEQTSDAVVTGNLIEGAVVGIYADTSTNTTLEDNIVLLPPANALTSDTHGISLFQGGDHQLARNLISGARNGLVVTGAPGVFANQTQMVTVGTGVKVSQLTNESAAAPQLEFHNARLATTGTPLKLTSTTSNLTVDAECNDWGVYHADLIPTRISDDGEDNTVDFTPYTSADADPTATCLVPPEADFTREPDAATLTRLDTIDFTDESEAGSRPLAEWRWDFGDGTTTSEQNPAHSYDTIGSFDIVLTVEDTDGMVSRAIDNVTIENIAPSLDPVDDRTLHHTKRLDLPVTATDAEGDEITLTAEDLPAGAGFADHGDGTGTLAWAPDADQYGTYTVKFTADDGQASNSTDQVFTQITVTNEAPIFDPPLPASLAGAETRELTLSVDATEPDADTLDDLSADLSALPANATFTTQDGDGDPTTGTLTWTPGLGENGTYDVAFIATGPGRTTTSTVTLSIGEENLPPAITLNPATQEVPENETVTINATADDPDGPDVINWTVTAETTSGMPVGPIVFDATGSTVTWSWEIPERFDEDINVTFTATDGLGPVSVNATVLVQQRPEATPRLPVETSTGFMTRQPIAGEQLELNTTAFDEDGTVTSVVVYPDGLDSTPIELTQQGTTFFGEAYYTGTVTYTTPGARTQVYEVTDDDNLTRRVWETIQVIENTPPTASATPDLIEGETEGPNGMTVDLRGSGTDLENRPLTEDDFEWFLDDDPTPIATGRRVSTDIPVGVHTVTLEVTDPYGATNTTSVTVKVDDAIDAGARLANTAEQFDDGTYRIDPRGHMLDRISGWVDVADDIEQPVEGAVVQVTAKYYGLDANDHAGLTVADQRIFTAPNGSAEFAFDQPALGSFGRGESLLSAPGYHEIHITASADSRDAGAVSDVEVSQTVLAYWVGPEGTGPVTE